MHLKLSNLKKKIDLSRDQAFNIFTRQPKIQLLQDLRIYGGSLKIENYKKRGPRRNQNTWWINGAKPVAELNLRSNERKNTWLAQVNLRSREGSFVLLGNLKISIRRMTLASTTLVRMKTISLKKLSKKLKIELTQSSSTQLNKTSQRNQHQINSSEYLKRFKFITQTCLKNGK